MLLRALRKGDEVITPAKQVAVVTAEADNDGRVSVRYLAVPEWQPRGETHGGSIDRDGRVLRIAESLLVYVPPRKPT